MGANADKRQFKYNYQLQQDAQSWQSNEAAKNRFFNYEQAALARDFELQMWNKTNEYNSPAHQRQMREAAGLNPFAGDYQSQAPMPSGSPVAAGGSQPNGVTPPYIQQTGFNPFQQMTAIADSIKSLSSSGLDLAQTKKTTSLLSSELENLVSDTNLNKSLTVLNQIDSNTRDKKNRKEIRQIGAMIMKLESEADLNEEKKSYYKSAITKNLEDANLSYAQSAQIIKYVMNYMDSKERASIDNIKSSTHKNEETANLAKEEAKTEQDMRPYKVESASNNAGPETDYQAIYSLAAQITEDADKARMVTGIIAGIHEVKDIGKTVADVITSFKKLGIQMKDSEVRKLVGMRASRKVTWKRLSDEGNMLYSYD
ncbi:DNA pilot protein [Dipodfec virus RodF1_11]|uniref:DNA pilot protein n=1 Tax=Dipodfec virus RodF1_11 TaxID=2929288 RepID=A0A976N2U0_9VIRU|nr:DNA pilot protein [Dipodfec virus RodF1_11]